MPAIAAESVFQSVGNPLLLKAIVDSVNSALGMCSVEVELVGALSVPTTERCRVTGLLGVHGRVSGFITLSLAERFAIKAVEGLAGEHFDRLTSQVVDGVGELTNIVAGGIKAGLSNSPWAVSNITVPSVIVGTGYQIAYAKGLTYLCAIFEHQDPEAFLLEDRLMQVSVSLLKL